MKTLLLIFGGCLIGLGIGLMYPGKPRSKTKGRYKRGGRKGINYGTLTEYDY